MAMNVKGSGVFSPEEIAIITRSAPYLRTRTGVAISGLLVAWPRESFLVFLATPFMW